MNSTQTVFNGSKRTGYTQYCLECDEHHHCTMKYSKFYIYDPTPPKIGTYWYKKKSRNDKNHNAKMKN